MDEDLFPFTEPQTVELLEAGFSPSWINSHNNNVDAPIIGVAGGGAAAAVAGPFCNPVEMHACGVASGGGGMATIPETLGPDAPPIILDNVSVDTRSGAPIQIIVSDCKPVTAPIRILIQNLKLKYTVNGTIYPLKYVSFLNSGSYGDVCKYSSSSDTTSPLYIAIAVKFYRYNNSSEEQVIDLINSSSDLRDCNTVTALVLRYNVRGIENSVGLMQLMDGDLESYVTSYRPNNADIKIMMKQIVIYLKCISDAGYIYTDLKLENALYKMIDGVPIFRLGDLDSIVLKSITGRVVSTSLSVEFIIRGRMRPKDEDVYWTIGCMLVTTLFIIDPGNFRILYKLTRRDITSIYAEATLPAPYYKRLNDELVKIVGYISNRLYQVLQITLRAENTRASVDTDGQEGYDRLIYLFS